MATDAELFKKYGVDPSKYRLDKEAGEFVPLEEVGGVDDIHPADVADEGVAGTIARRAAGSTVPTMASLAAMAKAGQLAMKAPIPHPFAKGAFVLGSSLLAGTGAGIGTGKLQHWAAEGLSPDLTAGWNQQEAINAEANPKSDVVGGVVPMAVSNKANGLRNAVEFAKGFFNPANMDPHGLQKGVQVALNSGLGGAMEAYHEFDRKKPFFGLSAPKIATAAAGNAMFGDFRKPVAKLLSKAGIPMHGDTPSMPEQMRSTPVKPGVGVKAAATVPESGATIDQQFKDAVDPRTSRMAVFVPKETVYKGRVPEGLTPVERADGVMYVNEQKGGSVNKAATAPEAPATELGMSQDVKPEGGDTVVTGQKNGVETTSEVVDGSDPTAVAKAAEAAKAASPDAEVTVKDPAEVIEERAKNNAASRRASVEDGLHLDQTQPEAEPTVGQYPPEGMGTGEIATPAEVVRRASVKESVDAAAKKKADAARWRNYLEEDGWDTTGMDDDQLANHDTPDPTRRKWQKDQQQPAPKSKISQAWYDLWKKLGFDKYGVTTDNEGKITTDTGEPARGEYDPMNRAVGVDTKRATPDTQPHEIFHAFIQDTLTHGTEGEKAFIRKAIEAHEGLKNSKGEAIDAEEALTQATGEHLVGRRDKKNDRLLSDMVAFLRYKMGRATRGDMQRLASGAIARGRGFAKEARGVDANATTTGGVKNQPDTKDDRTFVTDFEKELNSNPAKPFKIQVAKDGRMSANDVRAALSKAHPVEQELLKSAGIDEFLAKTVRPTPEELAAFIKENGPRVEVHSYGQSGKVSEARAELDRMTHEWWENLSNDEKYQVQRYKLGERTSLPSPLLEQTGKFFDLTRKVREEPTDTSPRATSAYNQVSPKDTMKFPVQRVDVVLPQRRVSPRDVDRGADYELDRSGKGLYVEKPKWSPDGLHENLPNTIGWAAIQYETLPSGEKVAHVYESQSRWGQSERKLKQRGVKVGDDMTGTGQANLTDHPLLKDYNRLILKAAIDEARKNGATKIAISDAETAMMSEMHDQHANEGKINQEGGMRFNYDNALPKIAEELTGSKGEPVNFGEHKNAVHKDNLSDGRRVTEFGEIVQPDSKYRDNLIFRNPDGTPKTDVTARMYDISAPAQRRANNEPYGLVNKRYQADGEGAGDVEYKTPSKAKTPILSSNLDLLRRSNDLSKQSVGNALANAWHERAENQGRYENMVMPLVDKLSKDSQKRVLDHWIETQMSEVDSPIDGGSEKEQAALDAIREMYRQVREDQNAQGMLVRDREGNEREGRFDPTGMPHLIDPDVHSRLKNEQGSEWWHSIIDPYRESLITQLREKHQTGRKNPISDAEIESIADAKIRNITGAEPMRGGTAEWKAHSKPLRLAESTKLTPEMIDTNLPRLLEKYIGQVSKDLAFHKYVESKPEIAKLIGEVEDANPRDVLAGNTDVAGALSDYRGDGVRAKGKIEKALGSVSDLAVAMLTANPVTRGADFITTAFKGPASAENPFQIPQVVLGMLKNVATGKAGRDARDTGLIRNMANYMDNLIGNTERVKGATRKIATAGSKASGSEAIERATRTMAQAYGDVLARIYVESARNGDKTAIHHLEQIAPDGEWATLAESDQGIARLATRIAKEFQGVYNNSNLSPHMTDGPAAPMLRMSKWSVEQANNFRKYQIDPLLKHGDPMPLAMYLAVMAGGSAAVQEFREWASGRKSYTPTWAELKEGKDGGRVTANAVAKITKAFESVGIAGAYMNLANMAAQAMAGQQSQEIVSPMVQAGTDVTRHVVQGSKAIAEGQDPSLVIPAMIDKMAQSQISMFRIARNWALNQRQKGIRENARDFGNYKLLQGDEKKPFLPIVSYDKMDEKGFDKADMSEAPGALSRSLRRQAVNDPSKLPDKIKNLGVIASTGEGPSLKDDEKVLEYIAFIKRTQGADRAMRVYRDLMQRDAERKAKREMVEVFKSK